MDRLGQSDGAHCGGWIRADESHGGTIRGCEHEFL